MKVKLSRSTAEYLRKETKYLKDRNTTAAIKFTNRIREAKRNIQQFPNMGSRARQIPIPGAQTWVTGEYLLD
jgi:plasmid stabilization system protein ParE